MATEVETEVLVIGGGVAACMAAMEASKFARRVTVVDKGMVGRSGSSTTADAGMSAPFGHGSLEPNALADSEEVFYQDMIKGGEGINDPGLVAMVARESCGLVRELEEIGVRFPKLSDGRYYQFRALGHSCARSCTPVDGGKAFMQALRREVLYRGARLVEKVMVTRLLAADGRVVGAYGFDTFTGEEHVFRARSVVLAAGSATRLGKYTSASFTTTGDALVLAYDLGARLSHLEFIEFTIIPKVGKTVISSSGVSPFMGRGSRLFNALGERVMERYDPQRLERTTRAVLTRSIYLEQMAGRGPVYNDTAHFGAELWAEFERNQPAVLHKLRAAGINYRKDRFEWVPAFHTMLGGVLIDEDGWTGIDGLFAAGECTTGIHGANRLTGNAFSEGLVVGKHAGHAAATYALKASRVEPGTAEIEDARRRIAELWGQAGPKPHVFEREVRDLAWKHCGVVRTGESLAEGLAQVPRLREASVQVANVDQLQGALEVRNLLLVWELIARAALLRAESRGQHYRQDFPHKDDDRWLRQIVQRKGPDGPIVSIEPAPSIAKTEWLGPTGRDLEGGTIMSQGEQRRLSRNQ